MTTADFDRARPYRPRAIRLVNSIGERLRGLGVGAGRWSEDELIRAARRSTGLSDFGDERFRVPLAVLLDSLESEARLHTVGRLITKARLVAALATRLRMRDYVVRHPQILQSQLPPPVVIAGLQRTGTTMLHRLLASDPRLRAVLSWEGMAPIPSGGRLKVDTRYAKARASERALAYMAPAFFAIHPVEASAPEEDVLLLDCTFMSTTPEATLHVPTYASWLETQDHTAAYEDFRTLLAILAHHHGPSRFVLKTPHHLEYFDVLRRVFPGVQIVQTHRDPARTLASFCSMVWHGRGVFSDDVPRAEVGDHWSRKIGRLLARSMAVREQARDEGFLDVSYYDLIDDPVRTVGELYAGLGLRLTPDAERSMIATKKRNPQHKHGQHRYRLADFGLDADGVEPLFAAYRKKFGVRHEIDDSPPRIRG
ncbi:MAG TPA: sulfotransferase [Candidatus Limnocylindrales bacterium]|nr:sulfotransferase [Candidatus Limnocylindrales bacterium]